MTIGLQNDYNQYAYTGAKAIVNNGVQFAPRNYNAPISSSEGSSLAATTFGVGIMGAINSICYTFKNFMKLFQQDEHFFGQFLENARQLHNGINADTSFIERVKMLHNQKLKKSILATLDKMPNVEGKVARYAEKAKKAMNEGNLAKSELFAVKARQRMPIPESKGIWGAIKKPFTALNNTNVMKKFSRTSAGRLFARGGGPAFAIFEGATQAFTEIIPAFIHKGFFAGIKQIGKSAVASVANIAGFIGGEAAGAPIGAALGSFFGPVGTLIGGFVGGIAGGFFVSDKVGKIAKAITGKSEMEKYNEEKRIASNGYDTFIRY